MYSVYKHVLKTKITHWHTHALTHCTLSIILFLDVRRQEQWLARVSLAFDENWFLNKVLSEDSSKLPDCKHSAQYGHEVYRSTHLLTTEGSNTLTNHVATP